MRVAEQVNDIWRFLVYDIGGKVVAEYGGAQTLDEGGVKYMMSDWQGSTRAMVSNGGYVLGRMDYTAFGEEIAAGKGLRTAAQGFGNANNPRQKYGLTERDDATGMDHTWFRKVENRAGRMTSPDPYNGSMSGDPQSLNRYAYVQNQPTNLIDPSGLEPGVCDITVNYETCLALNALSGHGFWGTGSGLKGTLSSTITSSWWGDGWTVTNSYHSFYSFFGGYNRGPEKTYGGTFDCDKKASDIFHRMRTHFPDFANFAGNFGPFGASTAWAAIAFDNTTIRKGATIQISNMNVITTPPLTGGVVAFDVSVRVSAVSTMVGSSMGFSFQTNAGHVLHPATISFLATDVRPGMVNFSISVKGEFAGYLEALGYYGGGSDLEDKIWRNVIRNVSKYCGNK